MTSQTAAIDAYLAYAAAIHWGHVGDLGRVDQALDDLLAIFDGQTK